MSDFFHRTTQEYASHYGFPRGGKHEYYIPVKENKRAFYLYSLLTYRSFFKLLLLDFINIVLLKPKYYYLTNENLNQLISCVDKTNVYLTLKKGTPGPCSKDTILFTNKEGKLISVVKVSDGKKAKTLLQSENRFLSNFRGDVLFRQIVPEIKRSGICNNLYFIEQTALECRTIPTKDCDIYIFNFLILLHNKSKVYMKLKDSCFYQNIIGLRTQIYEGLNGHWKQRINKSLEVIEHEIYVFDMVYCHRDFAPWNMGINTSEKLFVFDWEYSKVEYFPLIDYFHFYIMPMALNGNASVLGIKKFIKDKKTIINSISNEKIAVQLLAYLVDLSMFYISTKNDFSEEGEVERQYGILIDNFEEWR